MSTFLNFFPREKYIRKLVEALITQDDYSEYDENDGDDGDDSGGVGDDDDYQGKLIEAGYAEKPGWRVKSISTSEEQNVIVLILLYILYYGQHRHIYETEYYRGREKYETARQNVNRYR